MLRSTGVADIAFSVSLFSIKLPMSISLTPKQEHYLKRELIKLEINDEFEQFNDAYILRRFGFPFTPNDPKKDSNIPNKLINDKIPLSQFFFHNVLTQLPFLTADSQNSKQFWIRKVQVFYENFMNMQVSETKDRDELTKRKKMANKLNKLFLMIFNSGIGTINELPYFIEKNNLLQNEDFKPVESAMVKNLLSPSKNDLQNQLNENKFINGIHLNVVGVRLIEKTNSSTRFWNNVTMNINQLQKNDNYYEFIINSKIDLPESEMITVARRYGEFKGLHSKLKKKYPGKRLPPLPSKVRSEISVGDMDEDDDADDLQEKNEELAKEDSIRQQLNQIEKQLKLDMYQDLPPPQSPVINDEIFTTAPASPISTKSIKSPNLSLKSIKFPWGKPVSKPDKSLQEANPIPREKMRLGLRSYLHTLLEDIELSSCEILKEFLFKGRILHLTKDENIDIKKRQDLDLILLLNHLKFQNETYNKIQDLKQSSLTLRNLLLQNENGLIEIFNEIKFKKHINELSPMLKNFINWCKIEIAATIYQLFLGQDSSYEFFSQIKRIHSLMPYTIMINILKFTNPMSIMKTMIDLLMSNPFGGKSLLQTLFFGVLSDDIKSQNKIILELEQQIDNDLIERLKWYIFDSQDDYDLIRSLKIESKELNFDVLLTVLISPKITVTPDPSDEIISDLLESYSEYKKLINIKNPEDGLFVDHEKTLLYSNLRQLYKLYIRNHDKEIMQQLWSQPELNLILRDLFTMFYQPLVNLFKHSHVDQAFKHFQKFMDDLIELIDNLSHEIYSMDASKVVNDIMNVLTKHEDEFYIFLHDVYINDKDKIFEGFIQWINDILKLLRVSKTENNFKKIDLTKIINENKNLNIDELMVEINAIIEKVTENHELIKKRYLEAKVLQKKSLQKNTNISENWDLINQDLEFFDYKDFGINEYDISELQKSKPKNDNSSLLSEESDDEEEPLKNDEIFKLLNSFKKQVSLVLNDYSQHKK